LCDFTDVTLASTPSETAVQVFVAQRRLQDAIALARDVGNDALVQENFALARRMGALLGRLNDHWWSARLLSASHRGEQASSTLPEWDGSNLRERTLLVVSRNLHVGPVIRYGRLLALASSLPKRCITLVEPRLLALFQRTFPAIDVREAGRDDSEAHAQADVVASYETLIEHIGVTKAGRIAELPPLKPDAAAVSGFRNKYSHGNPLIGICWHSTNENKDLPRLEEWAGFLARMKATFVSIQYGDARNEAEALGGLSGADIIDDREVDSLRELDRFAAQVAALDAVVTVSNTGAHMAGALDVPMFVLLDDKDHLMWPLEGRRSDWYPSSSLYRKAARPWSNVFSEIEADLTERLDLKPSVS
jgi:hypothetical protein